MRVIRCRDYAATMPLDPELASKLHDAVSEEVPGRFVRVLDAVVAPDGRNAVVLVVLNADTPDPVLMISSCLYDDGRWEELVMTEGGDAGTDWLGAPCNSPREVPRASRHPDCC